MKLSKKKNMSENEKKAVWCGQEMPFPKTDIRHRDAQPLART